MGREKCRSERGIGWSSRTWAEENVRVCFKGICNVDFQIKLDRVSIPMTNGEHALR